MGWNDTRSRLWASIPDSPLNDAHGFGQRIDRDTVGGISVNHWLYISPLLVKSRSIYGLIHRLMLDRYRSAICYISVDTRYTYRPRACTGQILADVSTGVLTEASTEVSLMKYQ